MGRRPKSKVEKLTPRTERLEVIPEPPATLSPAAADYWRKVAPELAERGTLTMLALPAFEVLAETWVNYQRLARWLNEDPERYATKTKNGYECESVAARQLRAVLVDLHRLWQKFVMLPGGASAAPSGAATGGQRGAKGMTLEEWAALKTAGDLDGCPFPDVRRKHGGKD